ncbi:hypothetical protein ACHAO8_007238 [Botrytis cinerea]
MDLHKLTVKELLAHLKAAGVEKPTTKEGIVAFVENQSRIARRRDQARELAAIEPKLNATNGGPELESLLQCTTKAIFSGFDLSLPKLPKGIEAKIQVNMQLWHTRTESVNMDDQDHETGLQTPGSESGDETIMTDIWMGRAQEFVHGAKDEEEEEELDEHGILIIQPPRRETQPSPNVAESRKRQLGSPAQQITSISISESQIEAVSNPNRQTQGNEQTLEASTSNSRSAMLGRSNKKQKRVT